MPRAACPVLCQSELARRAQIEQPCRQHAAVDQRPPPVRQALGVERFRAMAARSVRVLGDRDRLGEDALSEPVLQKARAARDRRAGNRPQQMRDQAARDARIEHDRNASSRHLARAEPLDGALAGIAADLGRVAQIGGIDRAGEIVVALHLRAGAADHRDADPVARPGIAAGEPVRGDERDPRAPPAGLGALGIGDAFDRERGLLGRPGALDQGLGIRLLGVEHVERRASPARPRRGRRGR